MSGSTNGSTNGSTPCSEAGEKGLLCSFLLAPRIVAALCTGMRTSDFFIPAHRILFETLEYCPNPNNKVDFVWLNESLKSRNLLEEVGGKEYVSALYDFVPVADNAEFYRDLVLKASKRRFLRELADDEDPDNSPVWNELERFDTIVGGDEGQDNTEWFDLDRSI